MEAHVKPKPRLKRQDWVEAAFETLTSSGVGDVTIDRLAASLGVTRGSFYHHFKERTELLQEVLNYWIENWTLNIRGQIESLKLDPGNTLLALMRMIQANGGAEFETPFRAWALHDPMASEAVEKVDRVRLDFIRSQFSALGFEGAEAENRARLYLAYEMSAPSMFAKPDEELEEQLLVERHRFLTATKGDLRE